MLSGMRFRLHRATAVLATAALLLASCSGGGFGWRRCIAVAEPHAGRRAQPGGNPGQRLYRTGG